MALAILELFVIAVQKVCDGPVGKAALRIGVLPPNATVGAVGSGTGDSAII
jgi:hypothetical protein